MDVEQLLTIKREHIYPRPLILQRSVWIPVPLARFQATFYAGRAILDRAEIEQAYRSLDAISTSAKWVLGVAASVNEGETVIDEQGICYWEELAHVLPAEITRSILGGQNG